MASYLGKISALVTANTAPFRAALGESAKDLNRWRSEVNRTLNAAADGNWDRKILTKMQQVRQAIAAAQVGDGLNFRLDESTIRRIEQMYSAIEQIAKPLEKVRNSFDGLSASVQSRFLPALESVQREALLMRDAIEAGAKIGQTEFAALEKRVSGAANAISRLREIQTSTSGLSTGEELRFRAPAVAAQLARAGRIQPRAEDILGTSDQSTNRLFAMQRTQAERLASLRAQIEAQQMRATPDATMLAALVSSEQRYAAALQRTNDVLESRISNVQRMNALARASAALQIIPAEEAQADIDRLIRSQQQALARQIGGGFLNIISPEEAFGDTAAGRRISAIRQQIDGASDAARSALVPALRAVVQELGSMAGAGEDAFSGIDRRIARLVQGVRTLDEDLQSLTQGLSTGQEFRFRAPEVDAAIREARQLQAQAQQAFGVRDVSNLDLYARQRELAQRLAVARSERERTAGESAARAAAGIMDSALENAANNAIAAENRLRVALEEVNRELRTRIELQETALSRASALLTVLPFEDTPQGQQEETQRLIRQNREAVQRDRLRAQVEGQNLLARVESELPEASRAFADELAADRREAANRQLAIVPFQDTPEGRRSRQEQVLRDLGSRLDDELPAAQRALEDEITASIVNRERRARDRDAALAASDARIRREAQQIASEGASIQLPSGFADAARLRARGQRAIEASADFRGMQFFDVAFESRLRGEAASVRTLGAEFARLGVQAGGPTAQAFDRLTAEAEQFTRSGTIGSRQARQELERLRSVAIDTAVRVGDISPAQARTLRQRTGDIDRGGVDRFSLGIQQAAFAVEDFFSVTGGLDQRIRAAGNNISQLGFILGSTTGLFAGIGVTIAAQAIAPLLKLTQVGRDFNDWLESGRNKADSFRDSIAAQRQAVEDLAAAFGRLGASIDSASTSSFGRPAKDARAQVVSIIEGLRNVRERRLFSSDAGVLTADARVKAAENRLSRADTVNEAVAASRELEIAKQVQKTAREAAVRRAEQTVDVDAARQRADADIRAARAEFARSPGGQGSVSAIAIVRLREAIAAAEQSVVDAQAARDFQARRRTVDTTAMRLGGFLVGGNPVAALAQGFAGQVGPGEITRRLDEIGRIREELNRSISKAVEDGVDPTVFEQVVVNANKMQVALLGAASAMQEFIGISDRIKQTVSADVGSLEQRAEQARRAAVIGIPGAAADAVAAGDTAAEARRLRQRADDAVDIARRRIEQGVLAGDFTRLGQIETALQAQAIPVDERERLLAERRAIRDRVAATMESDPSMAAARAAQTEATRMAEFAAAADRGRELAMTPGQRAARDLRQQLGDVNAFFGQRAEDGGGLVDIAARNEAMQRVFRDAAEQAAPMFAQFRDEVLTARLQGPSRAALNMVDVATMEGQRELNRLLRGDDPARDVNLAELQKQTTALEELVTIARDFNVNVAD